MAIESCELSDIVVMIHYSLNIILGIWVFIFGINSKKSINHRISYPTSFAGLFSALVYLWAFYVCYAHLDHDLVRIPIRIAFTIFGITMITCLTSLSISKDTPLWKSMFGIRESHESNND